MIMSDSEILIFITLASKNVNCCKLPCYLRTTFEFFYEYMSQHSKKLQRCTGRAGGLVVCIHLRCSFGDNYTTLEKLKEKDFF